MDLEPSSESAVQSNKRLVIILAITTVLFEVVGFTTGNRIIDGVIALPLTLVMPGLTLLIAAGYPRVKTPGDLIIWVPTTSLVLVVLGGIFLNAMDELTRGGWLIYLGTVTLISCLIATIRFSNRAVEDRSSQHDHADGQTETSTDQQTSRVRVIATLAIAGFLVIGALTVSQLSVSNTSPRFTQLWMMPMPNSVATGADAQIGIHSFEGQRRTYELELYIGSANIPSHIWMFALNTGQSWTIEVARPIGEMHRVTLQFPFQPKRHYQYVELASRLS